MNQYQQFIKDTLNWARANDLVKTQDEFAVAVGLDRGTISSVLNERYSGKAAARKVELWRETVDPDFDPILAPYNYARKSSKDWESFRRETARQTLQVSIALMDRPGYDIENTIKASAKIAVAFADELIKQLKDGTE